ncbi:MAG TPA: ComEC/Rec2 family competence protein [Bacteroidales bacterium]|nr:ComEC/Rec2 family competence protein [Bacteroidales bacterium]HOM39940.1 ComEC/Rec2 family competence protein [Bacteroidales bacterium]HQK70338.1 ComEC/Rec2 family competence protein [Bacteroidales bacterium]HRR16198.1 ComEC/Rec2 family competence protein [Bacteroidales bacterium]HRT47743.1 ComEC/Rec2 family competence protein [Bacteroidales bacterium]
MLFKEIPFLRIFIPYCLGIAASFCAEGIGIKIMLLLSVFLIIPLLISYFTIKSYNNTAFGAILTAALFLSGVILAVNERRSLSTLEQKEQLFCSVVLDFPEEKENSFLIKSKLKYIWSDSVKKRIEGSIILYHSKNSQLTKLMPGDIIMFRTTPLEIRNKGNPYEFDYRFYMESKGFRYYGFIQKDDIIYYGSPSRRTLREKALIFREQIINMYQEKGARGKRLALAAAITLGEKSMLGDDEKEHFSRAGVMHIMAVSGLHAGVLSLFIFNILFFLKGKLKILRVFFTIATLWFFAFTTGLSPSVMRASLMFSFLHTGQLLNRKINPLNSLLASAFILSVINPLVIFDPAFQLSYVAVFFIILFYRDFYNTLTFNNFMSDRIWQLISVSFVAQAGTLPLTLAMFNRFSLIFLLSNILIVPLAAVIIISGFLAVITAPVGFVASIFVTVMDRTSFLAGYLTEKTSMLPFSSLENTGITVPESILLIIALAIFLNYLLSEKKKSVVLPLAAFLALIVTVTTKKVISGFKNELIVYNTQSVPVAGIKNGNTLNLFCMGEKVPGEALRHSAIMGLHVKTIDVRGKMPFLIRAGGKNILISDSYPAENAVKKSDIVIYTGLRPLFLSESAKPDNIILTSAYPGRVFENKVRNNRVNGLWFIKSQGCFRMKLKRE